MPAGFGSGASQKLPKGKYVAQVVEVKRVQVDDFNDKSKKVWKFRWDIDVKMPDGTWERKRKFTGTDFTDVSNVSSPQFVSNLNKLVRACGVHVPTSAEEAEAWNEDDMSGKQFGWVMEQDEDTGILTERFVTIGRANGNGNGNVGENPRASAEVAAARSASAPAREPVGAAVATVDGDDNWPDEE